MNINLSYRPSLIILSIFLLFGCCHRQQENVQQRGETERQLDSIKVDSITNILLAARKNQIQLSPISKQLDSLALREGYRLQDNLSQKLIPLLGPVVGYKMAFATESALKKYKLKEPVYGPLFKKQEIKNHGEVYLDDFMQFHIENEIAFVMNENIEEPIFYGLGNSAFAWYRVTDKRNGLLVRAVISEKRVTHVSFVPLTRDTENDPVLLDPGFGKGRELFEKVLMLSNDFGTNMQIHGKEVVIKGITE